MARQSTRDALARERMRRSQHERSASTLASVPAAGARRSAATTCGWCGGAIATKSTGRIPKWCSPTCRQRAWEQSRAAASGRSAVQVVERLVEVRVARERAPGRQQWPALVREIAAQLDAGRVFARDLPDLGTALNELNAAYQRCQHTADHAADRLVRVAGAAPDQD